MAKIQFDSSLVRNAKKGDKQAIAKMFSSFVGDGEQIHEVEYFGKYGVFFLTHSFICVTDKKIYALQYGPFGQIVLSDAFIEELNSGMIYQPSVFNLYMVSICLCITIVGILLLNSWVRLFYSLNKSGLVWCVREGINVYAFANRSNINKVNAVWRKVSLLREQQKIRLR